MSDTFVGLHRHSTGSSLDGMGLPEQLADRLVELGQDICAITDHGSIFMWGPLYKAYQKRGIKLIFGLEAYHVEDITRKGKTEGDKKKLAKAGAGICHLTLLAKNQQGYGNLVKLHNLSYAEGFYRKPCLDWNTLIPHQEGLVVLSGCVIGFLSKLINQGKADAAHAWAAWIKERVENYFIEVCPCPGLDISHSACPTLRKIAFDLQIPMVLTDDAHFPRPEDHEAESAMLAIQTHETMANEKRALRLPGYHYYCSGIDLLQRAREVLPLVPVVELEAAIQRAREIGDQCNAELPHCSGPKFTVPEGFDDISYLKKWVEEGKIYRRSLGLLPPLDSVEWQTYLEREAYELDIIGYHRFASYFLLVSDIIRWAKSQKYWCIARGSCGGSLICWYLEITQIDPIRQDLPVERFIDKTRSDLPDIDIDVDSRYRDKIFEYLNNKYGEEHCAQIAALSTFRAKQAIRDVGKVYEIPETVTSELAALLPELDSEAGIKAHGLLDRLFQESERGKTLLQQWPKLQVAARIEGQIRQQTIHAAGFVVNSEPLGELVGVVAQPGKAKVVACDMAFAPKMGLLKIDLLSVDMMSAIAETLETINKDFDWLYRLPMDDVATYRMLGEGHSCGVFQMKGGAATKLLTELKPTEFNDLVALAALARPGPLQSGGAKEYVDRKHGRERSPALHPKIDRILGATFQTILYQEQVMSLMHDVGQMDWPDVHDIRKLISKSGGPQQMERYRPQYISGALSEGVDADTADHVWLQCQRAGNYIFNKAHGCAYGLLGFFSAYLKAHYLTAFTVACVNHEKKENYRIALLREFKERGGKLILVDPNTSQARFSSPKEGVIVGGFANLKGCGEVMAEKLAAGQPYRDWLHFLKACPATVARALQQAGVDKGKIDMDVVLTLAPWYCDIEFLPIEKAAFAGRNAETVARLLERMETREGLPQAHLVGRVTQAEFSVSKHRKPGEPALERLQMTLSDETGSVDIWFSGKKWKEIREAYNPLRGPTKGLGNSVYVKVALSEDRARLFGEFLYCFRESGGSGLVKRKVEQPQLELT
jgi:DNA polymerase-3 subunit alpha